MEENMDDEEFQGKTIVIDNGGRTTRAGFAGDSKPKCVFRTVVGRPRQGVVEGDWIKIKSNYVGDEALLKRGILSLKYPIEYGIVTNWDDMERVWHHTFYNELKVNPEEHPVLLTEAPMNPKANREKMTQLMFETFHCPAMYVSAQAVLTMYAAGRHTGLVVDSGEGQSLVVTVYQGHVLPALVFKSFINARDLDFFLMKLLTENGHEFLTRVEMDMLRDMKEELCYVAYDYEHELKTATASMVNKSYRKPDDELIMVGQERFKCPEAIFKPLLADQEYPGVDDIVVNAIQRGDESIRTDLYANIQLSGGNTLFPGFLERLRKEVELRAPAGTNVKVHASPEGLISPWVGGSKMAASESFSSLVINKEDYDEYGPSLVHKKCF